MATSSKSFCHQEQYNHTTIQPLNYQEQYNHTTTKNNTTTLWYNQTTTKNNALVQTNQATRHPHSRTKHPTNNPTTLLTLPIRTHTTNYVEQYQTVQLSNQHQRHNYTMAPIHRPVPDAQCHGATVFGVVRNFLARAQSCDMLSQCRLFLLQRGMRGKAWFPLPPSKTHPPVMRTVVSIS